MLYLHCDSIGCISVKVCCQHRNKEMWNSKKKVTFAYVMVYDNSQFHHTFQFKTVFSQQKQLRTIVWITKPRNTRGCKLQMKCPQFSEKQSNIMKLAINFTRQHYKMHHDEYSHGAPPLKAFLVHPTYRWMLTRLAAQNEEKRTKNTESGVVLLHLARGNRWNVQDKWQHKETRDRLCNTPKNLKAKA